MRKGIKFLIILVMIFVFMSMSRASRAGGGFSLTIGTGNFYFSVGGYDYCNYYDNYFYGGPAGPCQVNVSFHSILSDYGYWTYYSGLGNVWVPRVAYDWRPYSYGHWIFTAYGWTWVSYEPWGWIPHHYGNWLFTSSYGWVWVPGYVYYPARVRWMTCGGYIGWIPIAPYGFSHYRGPWHGWYGCYNRPIYVNNTYINNYVFIQNRYFMVDNIDHHNRSHGDIGDVFTAGHYQVAEISNGPERHVMERHIGRKIEVRDMDTRYMHVEGRTLAYHRPQGEIENIRWNAQATVEQAVAPGFEEAGIAFKGRTSQSAGAIDKLFGQENRSVETRTYKSTAAPGRRTGRQRTFSTTGSGSGTQAASGRSRNVSAHPDSFRKSAPYKDYAAGAGYASKGKYTRETATSGKSTTAYRKYGNQTAGSASRSPGVVAQATKRSSAFSPNPALSTYGKNKRTSDKNKARPGSIAGSSHSNAGRKEISSGGKNVAADGKAGKQTMHRTDGSGRSFSKAIGKSRPPAGKAKGKTVIPASKEGQRKNVAETKQAKKKK